MPSRFGPQASATPSRGTCSATLSGREGRIARRLEAFPEQNGPVRPPTERYASRAGCGTSVLRQLEPAPTTGVIFIGVDRYAANLAATSPHQPSGVCGTDRAVRRRCLCAARLCSCGNRCDCGPAGRGPARRLAGRTDSARGGRVQSERGKGTNPLAPEISQRHVRQLVSGALVDGRCAMVACGGHGRRSRAPRPVAGRPDSARRVPTVRLSAGGDRTGCALP